MWSPFPIRIAYLTNVGGRYELHDQWGTLTHDYLVDRHVAAVTPSWRWDSQAIAYVRSNGMVVVHNAISGRDVTIGSSCGLRSPTDVAFAPTSGLLAIFDSTRLRVVDTTGGRADVCTTHAPGLPSIAWVRPRQLFIGAGTALQRFVLQSPGIGVDTTTTPGVIAGLTASPDGRKLALALADRGATRVVAAPAPRFSEQALPLQIQQVLLPPGQTTGPVSLDWQ